MTTEILKHFALHTPPVNRCYFTDSEIEKLLKKYNIEPQKKVHEDEARQLFRDVLRQKPS